jgi:prepilin-type N-terminal cleavage/methylation domain-containing protein
LNGSYKSAIRYLTVKKEGGGSLRREKTKQPVLTGKIMSGRKLKTLFDTGKVRPAGFTLVETLIVLVVLLILTAVTFSGMRQALPVWRLNAAARTLRADLVNVKSLSMKDMLQYEVVLTATGYQTLKGNAPIASTWTPPVVVNPTRNFTAYPGVSIVMAQTTSPILFNPDGTSAATAGGYTVVVTNGMKTKTLNVYLTGRIAINWTQ